MDQLEKNLEEIFTKKITYQLPVKVKDVIVQIAPWITLIILVISLPAVLGIFGLGSFMGGYFGIHLGARYYLGILVLAVQLVLMGMSIPGLMKRQMIGWKYVYYSDLVSAIYGIFSAYGIGSLVWSLLGSAIGLYIVFQVKSYYK